MDIGTIGNYITKFDGARRLILINTGEVLLDVQKTYIRLGKSGLF
jgi:hypothetical protein